MFLKSASLFGLLAVLIAGCGPATNIRPNDFSIDYQWSNGPVAPAYQYGYHIIIEPDGHGKVVMTFGYPAEEASTWTETFIVQQAKLDELYTILVQNGLYREDWQREQSPPGSGSESVVVTSRGKQIHLSSEVISIQRLTTAAMYSAIRALVPEAIWTKLEDQHKEYVKAHEK